MKDATFCIQLVYREQFSSLDLSADMAPHTYLMCIKPATNTSLDQSFTHREVVCCSKKKREQKRT